MGIVERKIREKEQRIQEILNAARVLFMSKGYSSTTMLDIAQESELSRRTIYLYFKSKEELSYHVMREAYDGLYERISTASDQTEGTAYEKMTAVKDAYMNFYINDFDQLTFTLLFDYRVQPEDYKDEEAKACFNTIQKIIEELTSIFALGQKDKSMLPLEDVRKSALTYMTMIQSTMQKMAVRRDWIQAQHKIKGREIVEEMFSILFTSIQNR